MKQQQSQNPKRWLQTAAVAEHSGEPWSWRYHEEEWQESSRYRSGNHRRYSDFKSWCLVKAGGKDG